MLPLIKRFLKNKLLHETIFYGVATAINRGLILLALPFLGKSLSIEEYGVWTLSQVLISLGAPLFSLNGSAGVLREGTGNKAQGFLVYKKYLKITTQIALCASVALFLLKRDWIFYTIWLVLIEAYLSLITAWYRSQDKHILYFVAVFTKLVALVAAIYLSSSSPSLLIVLHYQTIVGASLLTPLLVVTILQNATISGSIAFKGVIIFSLGLLPHGFSQWILSGSDRLIIKYMLGDMQLGYYSLAYTLSMSVMLINSGLGMTIPVDIIKHHSIWINTGRRTKLIVGYSALFLATSIALVVVSHSFKEYLPFLKDVNHDVLLLMPWILNGMYFLGIYLFFINYLFYQRKSMLVSLITTVAAIFNIVLTISLVDPFGIEGAAFSTFVAYLIYMAASMWGAIKHQSLPGKYYRVDIMVIAITAILNHLILHLIISF